MRKVARMGSRTRSLVGVGAMFALAACGAEATPVSDPATQPLESIPAVASSPSAEEPVDTVPIGEPFRIDVDRYQIDLVLPVDAGPDPMGEFTPPDFVIDSRRWMTDCCWLSLTVQNEPPLYPDEQLVETIRANDLEWTLFDTGEEGFLQSAVTTVNDISISIATQQRFSGNESTPEASQMVRALVESLRVRDQ